MYSNFRKFNQNVRERGIGLQTVINESNYIIIRMNYMMKGMGKKGADLNNFGKQGIDWILQG